MGNWHRIFSLPEKASRNQEQVNLEAILENEEVSLKMVTVSYPKSIPSCGHSLLPRMVCEMEDVDLT